jgi:glycosyltransferase involved in cell wall biosynthesis
MTQLSKKKILHCSVIHSIDDSRIFYKECVSLSKYDYDVSYIAKSSNNINFQKKKYLGVNLFLLKSNNRLINNLLVLRQCLKFHVIHFHDPELIIAGVFLKILRKKIIYDVHENYRQTILNKNYINKNLKWILVKAIIFFEFLANKHFNAIVVVTPKIGSLFSNKKTILVRNFPLLFPNTILHDISKEKNVIIYIGSLSEKRGIREIIKATEFFKETAELWIAGQWSDDKFRDTCQNMKEYKNIKYLGNLNHEEIPQLLRNSTIGICTLHPTISYIESYPIKAFEYFQNGLPVLMSNFETWKQMFGDTCEYVDPLNFKLIAETIVKLINDKSKLRQMSIKGINLVNQKFNWENEFTQLNNLYISI